MVSILLSALSVYINRHELSGTGAVSREYTLIARLLLLTGVLFCFWALHR